MGQHADGAEPMGHGPKALYEHRCMRGLYRRDPRQEVIIEKLQDLFDQLRGSPARTSRPSGLTMVDTVAASPAPSRTALHGSSRHTAPSSWWSNLLGPQDSQPAPSLAQPVKGLYMYGGVGCGKTMLMDVFVATAPPEYKVSRVHFHEFMLDVHSMLRQFKGAADPLKRVAFDISKDVRLLAMDEFFVTDVADAMILNRLFSRLWELGVVLVATSNRAPDALYENGLQRYLFLPFIERLKNACVVLNVDSAVDYRRLARPHEGLYFLQGQGQGDRQLKDRFRELAADLPICPAKVEVMMGRVLEVPQAAGSTCLFSFNDLCGRPAGAADYAALAKKYHTLCLYGIPRFSGATRSEAYRFTTLIDVLYEHRIRLLASAEAAPAELYDNIMTQSQYGLSARDAQDDSDAVVDDNLGFSKDRTVSRLIEMQSDEYLLSHAQQHSPELILALQEMMAKKRSGSH